jgi:acyl-CoA synthetase (NDP forming)
MKKACIPVFVEPEDAARALYGVMKYGEIRRKIEEDEKEAAAMKTEGAKA